MATIDTILNFGALARVRRNHALEHATLQVLAHKNANRRMGGYSDSRGFWIIGDVGLEELQQAVDEAQTRLRAGEYRLAVHPYCGTNFVTSGLVAGSFAWLGMLGGKRFSDRLERLPLIVSLVTLGMILAQPLGPMMQARFTVEPHIGSLQVTGIMRYMRRNLPMQRVSTVF